MALKSLEQIYDYGSETFSFAADTVFIEQLILRIENLSENYLLYPECRYLPTKSKIYRVLIYGGYIAIYRITLSRIEVLNVLHSSRSISNIKAVGKVRI